MDGTTAPRGARAPRTADSHPRTPNAGLDLISPRGTHADQTGTQETRPQASGRHPNGSLTGVANPNRVRVGSDGRPRPADRRHD
jgi:hypothetical protein